MTRKITVPDYEIFGEYGVGEDIILEGDFSDPDDWEIESVKLEGSNLNLYEFFNGAKLCYDNLTDAMTKHQREIKAPGW